MDAQLLSSKSEHWCTPPDIVELVRSVNTIELDPCSNQFSVVNATQQHTVLDDGLAQSWTCPQGGLVYCNPPYGRKLPAWVRKAVQAAQEGTEIILLTPARTDTRWFQDEIIETADAACFIKGRLKFIDGTTGLQGNPATFPSLLSYWGPDPQKFVDVFDSLGFCIRFQRT